MSSPDEVVTAVDVLPDLRNVQKTRRGLRRRDHHEAAGEPVAVAAAEPAEPPSGQVPGGQVPAGQMAGAQVPGARVPGVGALPAQREPEPVAVAPVMLAPQAPPMGRPLLSPVAELGIQDLLDHDRLTGLLNRDGFLRQLELSLPPQEPLAVVQVGVDNFRHINAGVGAEAADLVLTRVADVLSWVFAPAPLARVGGDLFAVLLPYEGLPAATEQTRRALAALAESDVSVDGAGIRATISAGITVLDRPGLTPRGCLQEADLAMSRAKANGRNRVEVHHAMETTTATAVRQWADRIRAALETDSLVLHAQPVVSLRGDAEQWELLVRLPLGDGELLPPMEFLPVAARFGLMQRVDEWVTRRAVRLVADQAVAGRQVRVEVNVGENTIASRSFTELVEAEVTAARIDPSALVFEVNGRAAAAATDDVRVFSQRLHDLGCLFALDNFGSSDGALGHLKTLPLDFVKIDASFVRHLAVSVADQLIVRSLTELAHGLRCKVIATSVGDDESVLLLQSYGVDYAQGFHIGRPQALSS